MKLRQPLRAKLKWLTVSRHRQQFKHSTMLRCLIDPPSLKVCTDRIEPFRVFNALIGRPAGFVVNQFNVDLNRISTFAN